MPRNKRRTLRFRDAQELFMLDNQSRRLLISTLSFYRSRLDKFINDVGRKGITDLSALDAYTIKRFMGWFQHQDDNGLSKTHNTQRHHSVVTRFGGCIEIKACKDSSSVSLSPFSATRI